MSVCFAKGLTDVNLLHIRLGHPAPYTLKIILKACNNFTALNKVESLKFCSACQYGKNHMLHFDSVETKTSAPLELIYADLWGPSHVCSTQGYHYYLSILDDYVGLPGYSLYQQNLMLLKCLKISKHSLKSIFNFQSKLSKLTG